MSKDGVKVNLVRPPAVVPVGAYIGSLTPPIGLAYLASSLKAGHGCCYFCGFGSDEKIPEGDQLIRHGLSFDKSLIKYRPTPRYWIVGHVFVRMEFLKPLFNRSLNNFLMHLLYWGDILQRPLACMDYLSKLDAIALGEAEETLVELADCIRVWNYQRRCWTFD